MRIDPALARGLFPDDVVARFAPMAAGEAGTPALPPEEAALVDDAHPRRFAEFALGRQLAREALATLGVPVEALGRDADRVPLWPSAIVGCISHTRRAPGSEEGEPGASIEAGLVGAVVAHAGSYRALGLDLEPNRATSEGVAGRVCFGDELDWIAGAGEAAVGRRCRVIFSIKEAVYKAFYPSLREVWGFDRVAVVPDLEGERFVASVPASTGYAEVSGRVRIRSGWILSGLALPARER